MLHINYGHWYVQVSNGYLATTQLWKIGLYIFFFFILYSSFARQHETYWIRNSYTMGCPPVCGDNPRALASGLSYVQVDKHGIFYTTYFSVDLAHHEIFRA